MPTLRPYKSNRPNILLSIAITLRMPRLAGARRALRQHMLPVAMWLFRRLRGVPGAVARPLLDPLHRPLAGLSHTVYAINQLVQPPARRTYALVIARGGILRLLFARFRSGESRRFDLQARLAELPESASLVYLHKIYGFPSILAKRPVRWPLARRFRRYYFEWSQPHAARTTAAEPSAGPIECYEASAGGAAPPLCRVMGAHHGARDVTRRFRDVLISDVGRMSKADILSFLRIGCHGRKGITQNDAQQELRIVDANMHTHTWA